MAGNQHLNSCGACTGIDQKTPFKLNNRPLQDAITYRIGKHSTFKQSMLAALSSSAYPALLPLGTREDDDFTIAYLDGVATVLDVLAFYQERYVNENFLRTSTERLSVLEMAQLIGYELSPGVAAATYLAFTLQSTPGLSTRAELAPAITIDAGTRVQSVPGQDEMPQTFETSEAIQARPQWNAVAAQTRYPYTPNQGDLDIYIDGISSNVEVGNAILIVGQNRMDKPGSERWDIRLVKAVEKDHEQLFTRLIWDDPLGHTRPSIQPSETNVSLFVFRRRVSLFGHNAPDYRFMVRAESGAINDNLIIASAAQILRQTSLTNVEFTAAGEFAARRINTEEGDTGEGDTGDDFPLSSAAELTRRASDFASLALTRSELEWPDFTIQNNQIDLATPEDQVIAGSWIALISNQSDIGSDDLPGYVELYQVKKASAISRSDYGISGRITRIEPDTLENLDQFSNRLRETLVLAGTEELVVHQRPLLYPVFSNVIHLAGHIEELAPGQYLSVSGKRQRLKIAPGITNLSLQLEAASMPLQEGDSLQLADIPETYSGRSSTQLSPEEFGELISNRASTRLKLSLTDRDGSTGTVIASASSWQWDDDEDDPQISEIVQITSDDSAILDNRDRTIITLTTALRNIYQRNSVSINFNVAPANHGETVSEILGNGDARQNDQDFVLKHAPLTHVSADTPSGATAALTVRVNELSWDQTPSLYQADSEARVYQINHRDDGTAEIAFGDGIEGGRLPTGHTNVRATYRKYLGTEGNLDGGKLTTLLQRPLGVSEVTNPEAATGGADPEAIEDARQNAPLTVLTLDRAVSVHDYQHYARAFAGVAKAHALWINAGPSKGIYITLAGVDGAAIPDTSDTYKNLTRALRRYGDPMLALTLVNYTPTTFALGMVVKVLEGAEQTLVLDVLKASLREHFSFANRDFGQHISQDQVLAVAHGIEHIEAVRITRFYKQEPGALDDVVPIIPSHLPLASLSLAPTPAELLILDPGALDIETFL